MRQLPLYISILLLCSLLCTKASAQTVRYVTLGGQNTSDCTDPNQQCGTIAYTLLQCQPGDRVMVGPGNYAGFTLAQGITVQGCSEDKTSIITPVTIAAGTATAGQPATLKLLKVQAGSRGIMIQSSHTRLVYVDASHHTDYNVQIVTEAPSIIEDIVLDHCKLGNSTIGLQVAPQTSLDKLHVTRCDFSNCGMYGIYMPAPDFSPSYPFYANDVQIGHSLISGCGRSALLSAKGGIIQPIIIDHITAIQNSSYPILHFPIQYGKFDAGIKMNGLHLRQYGSAPVVLADCQRGSVPANDAAIGGVELANSLLYGGTIQLQLKGDIRNSCSVHLNIFENWALQAIQNSSNSDRETGANIYAAGNYWNGARPGRAYTGLANVAGENMLLPLNQTIPIEAPLGCTVLIYDAFNGELLAATQLAGLPEDGLRLASPIAGGAPPLQGAALGGLVRYTIMPPEGAQTAVLAENNSRVLGLNTFAEHKILESLPGDTSLVTSWPSVPAALQLCTSGARLNLTSSNTIFYEEIDKKMCLDWPGAGVADTLLSLEFGTLSINPQDTLYLENDLTILSRLQNEGVLNINDQSLYLGGQATGGGQLHTDTGACLYLQGNGASCSLNIQDSSVLHSLWLNKKGASVYLQSKLAKIAERLQLVAGQLTIAQNPGLQLPWHSLVFDSTSSSGTAWINGVVDWQIEAPCSLNLHLPVGGSIGSRPIRLAQRVQWPGTIAAGYLSVVPSAITFDKVPPLAELLTFGIWHLKAKDGIATTGTAGLYTQQQPDGWTNAGLLAIARQQSQAWQSTGLPGTWRQPYMYQTWPRTDTSSYHTLGGNQSGTLNLPTVSITDVSPLELCSGGRLNISYRTNVVYSGSNNFFLEMSDETGSFAQPKVLNQVPAIISGSIAGNIPVNQAAGCGYLLRLRSTAPAGTSQPFPLALCVQRPPEQIGIETDAESLLLCDTGDNSITLSASGEYDGNYIWLLNGRALPHNTSSLAAREPGLYTLKIINSCGSAESGGGIRIQRSPLPDSANILSSASPTLCEGETLILSTDAQSVSGLIWKLDGQELAANTGFISATQSGLYTLTASNICASIVSDSLKVLFISSTAPVVSRTGNLLHSPAQEGNEWLDSNMQPIPGETNDWFYPGLAGTYYLLISANGCSALSEPISFEPQLTDISTNNNHWFSIYPNPASRLVYIAGSVPPEGLSAKLYTPAGRLINELDIDGWPAAFPLRGLPPGVYILRLTAAPNRNADHGEVFRLMIAPE